MQQPSIGFIGAGNMARSLISGLLKDGYDPTRIWASNPHQTVVNALIAQLGIQAHHDNKKVATACDIWVLSVKPQHMQGLAETLAQQCQTSRPLIISIAAGITLASLNHWLGGNIAIVRSMPNTPALVGCGASALLANKQVTTAQKAIAESILRAVGVIQWVDKEAHIDTATALSGSGPAYVLYLMEAMQKAGEELGLSAGCAKLFTLQTALGAARMALDSNCSLAELRQQVTSPGGTTAAGIEQLDKHQVNSHIEEAVAAAKARAAELAITFSHEDNSDEQ